MKKSEWFFILLPLFFVWALDHYTKILASKIVKVHTYGFLHFVLSHNHGALLGMFADLPALLRIVSLSTVGTFLVFSYAAIQYILPIKSLKLRLGMSLLVGGIVGNVTDRILWGYVIDFIILGKGNYITPPFNLADVIQWIGYFLICAAVIRDGELLWPEQNNRKKIWINHTYQYRYITLLIIIGLSLTLIGGVFSYTYLRVTITELIGKNNFISRRFLIPYLGTYIAICLIFCFALVLMGRIISHRTAGPIYAFQKYLEDLLAGKVRKFKLRNGDDFKNLEILAKKLEPYFKNRGNLNPSEAETAAETEAATKPVTKPNHPSGYEITTRGFQIEVRLNRLHEIKKSEDSERTEEINEQTEDLNEQLQEIDRPVQFPLNKTKGALLKFPTPKPIQVTTSEDSYDHQEEG